MAERIKSLDKHLSTCTSSLDLLKMAVFGFFSWWVAMRMQRLCVVDIGQSAPSIASGIPPGLTSGDGDHIL